MVQFNNIPGNLIAPIFTFEVSSGGQFENRSRLLLLGHKNTVAPLADNTPTICPSTAEGRALAGAGSMLDDMVRAARRAAPAQEIWICAVPATGTAAIRSVKVDTVPAAGGAGYLEIAGEAVSVSIAAGASATTVAAALAAAINAYYNGLTEASLPYTAAVDGVDDTKINLTARHAGAFGSAIDIHVPAVSGSNAFTGNVTVASETAGAGDPDMSAALAAMGEDPFDWIVSAFSDDTNVGRLKALLEDVSGRWAWNRQIYGHAFYLKHDTLGNLTTHGLAQNDRHITPLPLLTGGSTPHPDWMWAAGIVARIVPWLSDGTNGNVSRNQTGLTVPGLAPPRDRSKWLDYATRDSLLGSGISTWKVDSGGNVVIDKIITTYRTTGGVTDTTFRDIQAMGQLMYALRKFRADLTFEHGQKAIADANPGALVSLSTTRDIKATWLHSYQEMTLTGVLENVAQAAEITKVVRNADNANRVDIFGPIDRVNPLDIIAANAVLYAQF